MMKFENVANIGDKIQAFDFMPMEDRPDSYLIGRVIDKGPMYATVEGRKVYMCDGYTVYVTDSNTSSPEYDMKRIGTEMFVPFEMDIMEFDERVTLLA